MKLNPTLLELVLLCLISASIYIWVKYGKRIKRWWHTLHKRHRKPRQLKPREPADRPQCARGIHMATEISAPGSRALVAGQEYPR